MRSATFRVMTRGLQPGYSAEMVVDLVAALFKCSKEKAAPLVGSKPATVKRGLSHEAAKKYAQSLERCGCLCSVEEETPATAAPADHVAQAAPATVVAPPGRYTLAAPLSPQQLASITPVLRRVVRPTLEADPVVVQPFAGDLEILFLTQDDSLPVRHKTLQASMLTVEKLYALAVANLYERLHARLVFRQMATEEEGRPDSLSGARFFSFIEAGDAREASCLLLWPVWQAVAEQVRGPLRIAVPNAQTCLFCGADDEIAVAMMSDIAGETWEESGPGALSGLMFSVDANGQVTVVEDAHLQRPAPAMPLTPSAQLVAPVPHAQAGTAALLTLSEERLHRLQPVLFDLAQWSADADRTAWLASIGHALARGESRAAVVVDAAHAIVASYTDELDCVILLRFDAAMGLVHGWQNGTRLLSANSYSSRDRGISADLRPGPGDTGRWGNVWPLIADLLTDDHAGLAERKRAISEAEWELAWQMGRRALADRAAARDGRPMGSRQPANVQGQGESARKHPRRRRGDVTLRHCLRYLAVFGVCAAAVWGAVQSAAETPAGALFYVACVGIVLFSALGLGCLWRATGYFRAR